ncbi:hypothetical protein SAMN04487947_0808 [Halogeometricum rufum]|uniref:Uncharacterized protein n=1 Tax=Halogeometricum rufum TaxID=553469 RepID=A0A1I6G9Y8_9EURY|nr:hypothetical protein [Halogeometricum rufum]SFR39026.1 hypothetical protein SAMN04487947_0808 [Halogeometricum rufum]
MVTEAAFVVVFALLALGAPLVLYALIEDETNDPETMDRATAERTAQEEGRRRRR